MKVRLLMVGVLSLFWVSSVAFASTMESPQHHTEGEKMDMKPAKLGTYKKSEFWTKRKNFLIKAPLVPVTPGIARFEVQLVGRDSKLLQDAQILQVKYKMSGMTMELPDVAVRKVRPGVFELVFPIHMAGFWKVELVISSAHRTDEGTIKFVTK